MVQNLTMCAITLVSSTAKAATSPKIYPLKIKEQSAPTVIKSRHWGEELHNLSTHDSYKHLKALSSRTNNPCKKWFTFLAIKRAETWSHKFSCWKEEILPVLKVRGMGKRKVWQNPGHCALLSLGRGALLELLAWDQVPRKEGGKMFF